MGQCICCPSKIERLKHMKDGEVPFFSLQGQMFTTKIVDIYDGDTCSIVIYLKGKPIKFRVRCAGYDSPEIKPLKIIENRDQVIVSALQSRNYFVNLTTNCFVVLDGGYSKKELKEILKCNTKLVTIICGGWDKYGRLLGDFYADGVHVNQQMIDHGFAVPYDGGTKQKFNIQ